MFKHLRRITSSGKYIAEVDGVRFVAIVPVLLLHLHERLLRKVADRYPDVTGSHLDRFLLSGSLGVFIFFALSGYVVYGILRNNKADLKKYFLRRVTRLEPPYIIVSTILFLVLELGLYHGNGSFLGKGGMPLWQSYLATITYTHGLIFGTPPSVNPPGWSLETEIQFYILAPLLAAGMAWFKDWRARVGVLVATIFLWSFIIPPIDARPHIQDSLLHWFPYFLVGFAVFEIVNHNPPSRKLTHGIIDVLAVGALIGLPFICGGLFQANDFLKCLFIGLFMLGALSGTWLRRLLQTGWVASLGGMCYTIYLVHVPCIEVLVMATSRIKLAIPYSSYLLFQTVLIMPLVLFLSAMFFLLVERPCMNKNWPTDLLRFFKRKLSVRSGGLLVSQQSPAE